MSHKTTKRERLMSAGRWVRVSGLRAKDGTIRAAFATGPQAFRRPDQQFIARMSLETYRALAHDLSATIEDFEAVGPVERLPDTDLFEPDDPGIWHPGQPRLW